MSFWSKTARRHHVDLLYRWAVDAIESIYVALRIVKRRPIISKPFVGILSLTLQNDTTGRMAKAFVKALSPDSVGSSPKGRAFVLTDRYPTAVTQSITVNFVGTGVPTVHHNRFRSISRYRIRERLNQTFPWLWGRCRTRSRSEFITACGDRGRRMRLYLFEDNPSL